MMFKKAVMVSSIAILATASGAIARDNISIVGSSTVYPIAKSVINNFKILNDYEDPEIVSTGSGGGFKLFCAGVGAEHPDITNASRRMKSKELTLCQNNGVQDVVEVIFGYDGISLVNAKGGPELSLSVAQLTTALAEQGPKPAKWSDIDASLPDIAISVMGPPEGAGTRDALVELVLEKGCEGAGIPCDDISIRTDSAFVETSESVEGRRAMIDNLLADHNSFGVLGYSYLFQNSDKMQGAVVGGVAPTFDSVSGLEYPVSRPLYFYIKKAHIDVVPGIQEYAEEFMLGAYDGEEGYLVEDGLIPITETVYFGSLNRITDMTSMIPSDFEDN